MPRPPGDALAVTDPSPEAPAANASAGANEPKTVETWLHLAHAAGGSAQALQYLRRATAATPGDRNAGAAYEHLLLREAIAAARSNRKEEARDMLRELSQLTPGDERVWLWLASVARGYNEAIDALTHVLTIAPGHGQAQAALDRLRERLKARGSAPAPAGHPTAVSPPVVPAMITQAAVAPAAPDNLAAQARAIDVPARTDAREPAVRLAPLAAMAPRATTAPIPAASRPEVSVRPEAAALPTGLTERIGSPEPAPLAVSAAAPALPAAPPLRLATATGSTGRPAAATESPAAARPSGTASLEQAAAVRPGTILHLFENPRGTSTAPPASSAPASTRPVRPQADAVAPRPATSAIEEPEPPRGVVLVVDDSPTVLKVVSHELRKHRLEVVTAANGREALELLETVLPDLVLLDINMPLMDGYHVCRSIRGNDRTSRIPVVMLSGKDGFFDKIRGRLAGAAGYITKPFERQALLDVLEKHVPVRL